MFEIILQERLFFVLANELIKVGRIPGVISGGKKASKATYIPHSYAKAQSSWADNFFQQNSYVEVSLALFRIELRYFVSGLTRTWI